ncbi:MAG: hypothetical protein M1827_005316 [Pycnora praestabilis]|nr:MAG: hypothetical protein M1827_005316 [Pycnora praestabilis]
MAPSRATDQLGVFDTNSPAALPDHLLEQLLAQSFDPVDYLNSSLPPLSVLPQSHPATQQRSVPLAQLSTHTQKVLSQISAHTARLSNTLTQLTDEILRSGGRLAYEVEILRGETIGLSEVLTEGLQEDVKRFIPDGLTVDGSQPGTGSDEEALDTHRSSGFKGEEEKLTTGDEAVPPYLTHLRTLSLVRSRLETVIQVFGSAMDWTLPPSEVSVTSSLISVSAPEPGSENYSREEKGQEVSRKLRDEITELLVSDGGGEAGVEVAVARVEELRNLAGIWKGTAEEKARNRLVEGLAKMVEDRNRSLQRETSDRRQRDGDPLRTHNESLSKGGRLPGVLEPNGDGRIVGEGGYGLIDNLQRLRGQITLPQSSPLSGYLPSDVDLPFGINALNDSASPFVAINHNSSAAPIKHSAPTFHLLIPASEPNANLCKTILSALILEYPPPTLINFNKSFNGDSWDKGSHTGKIRGVFDFLQDEKQVKEKDLVLIIDGYDVWFQLPPEVLISRYHDLTQIANKRLSKVYGTAVGEKQPRSRRSVKKPKYAAKVFYAADKLCWPNQAEDPACAAVPPSTLPDDTYGIETDKDPEGYHNRPKYLNSGTIIGLVSNVKAIYQHALYKVEERNHGGIGDQFVFNEIFGEQEYQRRAIQQSKELASSRWGDWLLGRSGSPGSLRDRASGNTTLSVLFGGRYEFGLGLDYEATIFQTMTHSHDDVEYRISRMVNGAQVRRGYGSRQKPPLAFPADIQRSESPFPTFLSANTESDSGSANISSLDALPIDLNWQDIPLAVNHVIPSIPTLLHFNGNKSYLDTWWPLMWYHNHSRALLRQYIRSPQRRISVGGRTWADNRGGKGGVWTDDGQWLEWTEICGGYEEEIFRDGKGKWGKEEGSRKIYNAWGALMDGEED